MRREKRIQNKEKILLSREVKEKIVQDILDSPLNVDWIPDELERKIYEVVLELAGEASTQKGLFSCCR